MTGRVEVTIGELVVALADSSAELHHYLDLETGRVILIPGESDRELDRIYEEIYRADGSQAVPLEAYLEDRDAFKWQKELLLLADEVRQRRRTRYIRVERDDPYADYADMERFISKVEDPQLRDRLWRAIKGRGAFRRFKDLLFEHPDTREDWFAFKNEQDWQRAEAWLAARDIEPIS